MTYFEETWVAEKEQRRHSIEREIEIKESELYNKNKPPPLFYGNYLFYSLSSLEDPATVQSFYRHLIITQIWI